MHFLKIYLEIETALKNKLPLLLSSFSLGLLVEFLIEESLSFVDKLFTQFC